MAALTIPIFCSSPIFPLPLVVLPSPYHSTPGAGGSVELVEIRCLVVLDAWCWLALCSGSARQPDMSTGADPNELSRTEQPSFNIFGWFRPTVVVGDRGRTPGRVLGGVKPGCGRAGAAHLIMGTYFYGRSIGSPA